MYSCSLHRVECIITAYKSTRECAVLLVDNLHMLGAVSYMRSCHHERCSQWYRRNLFFGVIAHVLHHMREFTSQPYLAHVLLIRTQMVILR